MLLTRLPVGRFAPFGVPPDLARCVWAFPIVGLAVNGRGRPGLLAGLPARNAAASRGWLDPGGDTDHHRRLPRGRLGRHGRWLRRRRHLRRGSWKSCATAASAPTAPSRWSCRPDRTAAIARLAGPHGDRRPGRGWHDWAERDGPVAAAVASGAGGRDGRVPRPPAIPERRGLIGHRGRSPFLCFATGPAIAAVRLALVRRWPSRGSPPYARRLHRRRARRRGSRRRMCRPDPCRQCFHSLSKR